jgi:mannosyltransferase OCH1-like enzyme
MFEQQHSSLRANITVADIVYHTIKKDVLKRVAGKKQLIPYIIHQTNEFDKLPADMVLAMESVIEQNPEYEFHYYNGTQRRGIIK